MTRINAGINPCELPDKLLLAEHREITRIPNKIRSGRYVLDQLPRGFTLGTGHVRFFYKRIGYLARRYQSLLAECQKRGFAVTDKSSAFIGLPKWCYGGYFPTIQVRQIVVERIESKGFRLLERNAQ